MSAVIGGCDGLTVQPFDNALNKSQLNSVNVLPEIFRPCLTMKVI